MLNIFDGIGDKLRERDSRDRTMGALLSAAARGSRYSAEQIILEQLRFDEIDYRYDNIREAHEHTLSWLFSTGEQHSPATFHDWLGSDDDLYWISGKPGSGKSTLMKFLSRHPHTIEKLDIWAKQKRLITAEYFFWEAGKSLQKSQEGLLRSLLYEILRQYPDIIPQAYPNTWRFYFPEGNEWRPGVTAPKGSGATIPLSVHGLLDKLEVISNVAMESDSKFLFCIDGLDEYEGQANDMIELVRQLRNLPNLKLCVSSRPWNEFESEFSKDGSQKLYMQDFNSADISAYVYDTFAKDENYQELEDRDLNGKPLLNEIVLSANGVFFLGFSSGAVIPGWPPKWRHRLRSQGEAQTPSQGFEQVLRSNHSVRCSRILPWTLSRNVHDNIGRRRRHTTHSLLVHARRRGLRGGIGSEATLHTASK
jgi:hypothetical protein